MGDRLQDGEKLEVGQKLTSSNGAYEVVLQDDGNLVLYAGQTAVWSTETNGQNVVRAEVQKDGNFVLYDQHNAPVWASNTAGSPGAYLAIQDDGNMVVYRKDHHPLWSTNTG